MFELRFPSFLLVLEPTHSASRQFLCRIQISPGYLSLCPLHVSNSLQNSVVSYAFSFLTTEILTALFPAIAMAAIIGFDLEVYARRQVCTHALSSTMSYV